MLARIYSYIQKRNTSSFLCTCRDDFLSHIVMFTLHILLNTVGPDAVPPEITSCPANQPQPQGAPIYALSGQMATYNFPDAQATDVNDLDQSTTPVISYTIQTASPQTSLESTGQFPVGTTSVTVTATDGSGNEASCSFTVTVTLTTGKNYSSL